MAIKATGRDLVAAVKIGAVWGTPVACGAGDGLLILPHSVKKARENNLDDSLGLSHSKLADPDVITCEGAIPGWVRYEGLDLLIALIMGATGGAPAQIGGTAAYSQTFTFATLEDLYATLAVNLNVMVEEFPSMKVVGMKISGEVGKPIEFEFTVICDDMVEGSATNTTATMANVTFVDTGNRVLFRQGVWRLNLASAGALASPADVVTPSAFELDIQRPHAGQHGAGTTQDVVDEPSAEEVPQMTLKLTFPRLDDNTHFVAWDAGAFYKGDITFTGATIEGANDYQLLFEFPALAYQDVDDPKDQGPISNDVMFDIVGALVAPTGMAVTDPLKITSINTRTTDVLA